MSARPASRRQDCADFLDRIVYFIDNELDDGRLRRGPAAPRHVQPVPGALRPAAHRQGRSWPGPAPRPPRRAAPAGAGPDPRGPDPDHRGLSPSHDATSPRPVLGAGAQSSVLVAQGRLGRGSGVGALAVVGGLLLASAALATGLAHGDPPVESCGDQCSAAGRLANRVSREIGSEPAQEPLGVDDHPGDLAGADHLAVPPACRAATVKRCSRPSTYDVGGADLDLLADRAGGRCSSAIRVPTLVEPAARVGLERGAGGGLAPREQPRACRAPAGCPSRRAERGVVVGDRERQGRLQSGPDAGPAGRRPGRRRAPGTSPAPGRARSRAARRAGGRRSSRRSVESTIARARRARGSGRSHSRTSASPTPGPGPRATASIRNSPSSSRPISRHGEPVGQTSRCRGARRSSRRRPRARPRGRGGAASRSWST